MWHVFVKIKYKMECYTFILTHDPDLTNLYIT